MQKRTALGLLAALPILLAGCGGGNSDDSKAKLRLVNASPGYAALDLTIDEDSTASAVAYGSASSFTSVSEGELEVAIFSSGGSTELINTSPTLSGDTTYSIVAYGWEGALKTITLTEDEDAADSNETKVRVFNGAADAGSVDVYLTATDETLASSTPVVSTLASSAISSYSTIKSGTWRLRVTAAGDTTDLRLDVPSVTLTSKGVATLVLVPGSGGVLVHAVLVPQGNTVSQYLNTSARVRAVAAMAANGTVTMSTGGTALASGSKSPTIRPYVLVTAGTQTVAANVNGTDLTSTSVTLAAGSDTTLLVTGNSASDAQIVTINDDNRLPAVSSRYKLRLIHASPNHSSEGLTLTMQYSDVVSDLAFASASSFSSLVASTSASLEVTAPSSTTALYSADELTMAAQGIYTVFVFDSSGTTTGVLRKDR